MWLKFSFFPDRHSLLAAVASDGNVYFKASDVGKFLGYSNHFSFAKRHATRDLRKMIPCKFTHGRAFPAVNTTMVFDFEEMISAIRKTFKYHQIPCDEKRIAELENLWHSGSVSTEKYAADSFRQQMHVPDPKLHLSHRAPFPLEVRAGRPDGVNVQKWIGEFSDRVLKMLEEANDFLRRGDENSVSVGGKEIRQRDGGYASSPKSDRPMNDLYDTSPSSVNIDYYSSPPPSCNSYRQQENERQPQHFKSVYPIFGLEYDGFENNLPEEIHVVVRGKKHVFLQLRNARQN